MFDDAKPSINKTGDGDPIDNILFYRKRGARVAKKDGSKGWIFVGKVRGFVGNVAGCSGVKNESSQNRDRLTAVASAIACRCILGRPR